MTFGVHVGGAWGGFWWLQPGGQVGRSGWLLMFYGPCLNPSQGNRIYWVVIGIVPSIKVAHSFAFYRGANGRRERSLLSRNVKIEWEQYDFFLLDVDVWFMDVVRFFLPLARKSHRVDTNIRKIRINLMEQIGCFFFLNLSKVND